MRPGDRDTTAKDLHNIVQPDSEKNNDDRAEWKLGQFGTGLISRLPLSKPHCYAHETYSLNVHADRKEIVALGTVNIRI